MLPAAERARVAGDGHVLVVRAVVLAPPTLVRRAALADRVLFACAPNVVEPNLPRAVDAVAVRQRAVEAQLPAHDRRLLPADDVAR